MHTTSELQNLHFEYRDNGIETYSHAKQHRFELTRKWGIDETNTLIWIGLQALKSDTDEGNLRLENMMRISYRLGFDEMALVNLNSLICEAPFSEPDFCTEAVDFNTRNKCMIGELLSISRIFVCCWGTLATNRYQTDWLKPYANQAYCLGLTEDGFPLDVSAVIPQYYRLQKFNL